MFYTINRLIACALLLTTASSMAFAQSIPDITIINNTVQYDVQADGRYTVEERGAFRIETPQAVQRFGQAPIPYNSTLQQLDVLEAYVIGKDGKRTDVPADRIMVQQTPLSAGAPMFEDGKVKVVIFPGVEVGSVLHLHTRMTQLKPVFPGHFSMVEASSGIFNIESAMVTLRAPATLKLYVDAVNLEGGAIKTDQAGKQNWRWKIKNLKAQPLEAGSVAPQDVSPRVAVTTLASDQEAAKAYRDRALPQTAVTPSIQTLANEITKGITDRRAQAEAIYRWVSANIRYVAVFLDMMGSVVPHAADEIAKARYGDCKDHTTILGALLAAKGISSNPVLVNTDLRFWKPAVAATPGVFNHVILRIPEFNVYLDSTIRLAPFGTLAVQLRGKPALIVDGDDRTKTVTLPLSLPAQDQVRVAMKLVLEADGTVNGHADVENQGIFDLLSRLQMVNIPQDTETQTVGNALAITGQNGSGSLTRGKPYDLTSPYHYSTDFTLPNYVQLPGPGAFIVPQGFSSTANIAATFDLGLSQRMLPALLPGRRVEETIKLQLPATLKLTTLPSGTQLKWAHGSYESKVKAEGSTVIINRVLILDMPGPLLKPEDYLEFRTFGQAVIRDLRTQLVY